MTDKYRIRIRPDDSANPTKDMDLMCEFKQGLRYFEPAADHIRELLCDTTAWKVAERIREAAFPDDYEDHEPDLCDPTIRTVWEEACSAELLLKVINIERETVVAHTTPAMCAKLGVDWEFAAEAMDGEIEMYKQWAMGEVYGFIVDKWVPACACEECDAGEWEHEDSCWGFYGRDPFTNGMSDHIDEELHDMLRAATEEY